MRWERRSSNWTSFSSPWARAWDGHEVVDLAVGRLALHYAEENPDEVLAALDDKTEAVIRELEARQRRRAVRCDVEGIVSPTVKKISKKELRELKVECEEFHGEWNYVIRSRMDRSTSPFPVPKQEAGSAQRKAEAGSGQPV
jgi:hypothetical protein